jgi:pimeloyl-ACP methyl ester carboxylesterase
MPELGPYGSVRGARGNSRPYRDSGRRAVRSTLLTPSRHCALDRCPLALALVHSRAAAWGAFQMTSFVLVHGAWGGAHSFRHVRRVLRSKQHEVSTPSLTGVGERIHISSPLVSLGTHIRDVVNHVLYEDLNEIVLVGFSYGGFVVTGALEHIAERVSHLVYLEALVPKNGETVLSHVGREARAKIELGQNWLVTGPMREFDSPAEAEWMRARVTTRGRAGFRGPRPSNRSERSTNRILVKGLMTLKDCPWHPVGSARPRLLRSRETCQRSSSILC